MTLTDVLILTALPEEETVFRHWLNLRIVAGNVGIATWKKGKSRPMRISLVSLGGMGSVMAAVVASSAIQNTRPKVVILAGIAAGRKGGSKKPEFRLGDVACSRTICYYSYGKIAGKHPYADIRNLRVEPSDFFGNQFLLEIADCDGERSWRAEARKWFRKLTGKFCEDFSRYPKQRAFRGKSPRARLANFASGEWVIKSDKFKQYIRESYRDLDINVFEMESFAVARVCAQNDIPFIAVKGITDHATILKNDEHRLSSIAAATAFTKAVLWRKYDDIMAVIDRPQSQRGLVTCLNPNSGRYCQNFFKGENPEVIGRTCVDIDPEIFREKPSWLTRVFENVRPNAYSRKLSTLLPTLISEGKTRITLLFPYPSLDLLDFLRVHSRRVRLTAAVKAVIRDIHGERAIPRQVKGANHPLAEKIRRIGQMAESQFMHFKVCDDACRIAVEEGKVKRADLPSIISRIIVLGPDVSEEELLNDPLNVIYPCFLGLSVPTFYTSIDLVQPYYPIEDTVFFDRTLAKVERAETSFERAVVSARFFESAWTLMVSGKPCPGSGLREDRQMFDFLADWEMHSQETFGSPGPDAKYRPFPSEELLKRYLPKTGLLLQDR